MQVEDLEPLLGRHAEDQAVDLGRRLLVEEGDHRGRHDLRRRVVAAQPGDQILEILREIRGKVLPLDPVVDAVANEDPVEARQRWHDLVVAPRVEEAVDGFAADAPVDDLAGLQAALGGEELLDHRLEMRSLGLYLSQDAASGGAVAEQEDLELALVLRTERGDGKHHEKQTKTEKGAFHFFQKARRSVERYCSEFPLSTLAPARSRGPGQCEIGLRGSSDI